MDPSVGIEDDGDSVEALALGVFALYLIFGTVTNSENTVRATPISLSLACSNLSVFHHLIRVSLTLRGRNARCVGMEMSGRLPVIGAPVHHLVFHC